MADIAGLPNALPLPNRSNRQGCSRVIKIVAAVGALFIVIGITFAAVPAIPSIASSTFLGIGTPLLTVSLIGALCQTNALEPATKWKTALVVSLILFGGGIGLVATTAGAAAALGIVMLTVGSSTLLTTIIGSLSSQCHRPEEDQRDHRPDMGREYSLERGDGSEVETGNLPIQQGEEPETVYMEEQRRLFEDRVRACVGDRELDYKQVSLSFSLLTKQLFESHTTPKGAAYPFAWNTRGMRVVAWFRDGDLDHIYILMMYGQSILEYTRNGGSRKIPYSEIPQVSMNTRNLAIQQGEEPETVPTAAQRRLFEDRVRECVGDRRVDYNENFDILPNLTNRLFAAHPNPIEEVFGLRWTRRASMIGVAWFRAGDPDHIYILMNDSVSILEYTRNGGVRQFPYSEISQVSLRREEH